MVLLISGVVLATIWGIIQYRNIRKERPKATATLVAPPPNIHIDPENIPEVPDETRRWSAADATVQMGVPLKPREN